MADLDELLEENLSKPRKVKTDEGEVETHSLSDQVEAAKYLAQTRAAKKCVGNSLRQIKLQQPGAVV